MFHPLRRLSQLRMSVWEEEVSILLQVHVHALILILLQSYSCRGIKPEGGHSDFFCKKQP